MTGGGGAGSAMVIVAGRDVVSAMVKCRLLIIVLAGVVSNPRRACSIAANISGGTWRNEALGLLSVSSATSAGGMYGPALRTRLCVRTTIIIAAIATATGVRVRDCARPHSTSSAIVPR